MGTRAASASFMRLSESSGLLLLKPANFGDDPSSLDSEANVSRTSLLPPEGSTKTPMDRIYNLSGMFLAGFPAYSGILFFPP